MNEPRPEQSNCVHCGNAEINHTVFFIDGCINALLKPVGSFGKWAPDFLERFVDGIPGSVVVLGSYCGLAHFSSDMDKAVTHRSRVIWEEALRRGIPMEQCFFFKKPLEFYRAKINNRWHYFQSLPIPPLLTRNAEQWDDKITLKKALAVAHIPTPRFREVSLFSFKKPSLESLFEDLGEVLIVKPRVGSRGRHTTTHIRTPEELSRAISVGQMIAPRLSVEEHILGDVCRATLVDGTLAGFFRASVPSVTGDGVHTVAELIEEKNKHRPERIEPVAVSDEIKAYVTRQGYALEQVLPKDVVLPLTHRTGRFWGGTTKEMIDELHPSFIPILEQAAKTLNIAVVGFDVIVPDPTKPQESQRWGIIESNTLPFIDLHYYALEGTPRNIAGMIWDLWDKEETKA